MRRPHSIFRSNRRIPPIDATGENAKKTKRYTQEQAIAGEATFAKVGSNLRPSNACLLLNILAFRPLKYYTVAIEHATRCELKATGCAGLIGVLL